MSLSECMNVKLQNTVKICKIVSFFGTRLMLDLGTQIYRCELKTQTASSLLHPWRIKKLITYLFSSDQLLILIMAKFLKKRKRRRK